MLVTTKTRTSLLAIPFIKLSCDAQHSSLPVDPRFAARANQCFFSPAQRSWHLPYLPRLSGLFEGLVFGLNWLSHPPVLAAVRATLPA